MGGVAFAIGQRFGACQPVEYEMREGLVDEGDVALNAAVTQVQSVETLK
jgi:hypothetical protein